MKKLFTRILTFVALALMGVMALPQNANAQTTTSRFTGTDPSSIGTDQFLLYNVGTGKLVYPGGCWGTQATVKYQDYGLLFKLSNNLISGSISNSTYTGGKYMGVNVPQVTSAGSWGNTGDTRNTFGVILEAQASGSAPQSYSRNLTYESANISGINAYYIKETVTSGNTTYTYYWGTTYGITDGSTDGTTLKEVTDGSVVYAPTSVPTGYESYYQWQFVSATEIQKWITTNDDASYGGLDADATYLIKDADFTRNHDEFSSWTVTSSAGSASGSNYKYNWCGSSNNVVKISAKSGNGSGATTTTRPWDALQADKFQFDLVDWGKYTGVSLSGVGTFHQNFTAPLKGVYAVGVRGFWKGNEAYLYVTCNGTTTKIALPAATNFTKCSISSSKTSYSYSNIQAACQALYDNENEAYSVVAFVTADKDATVTIGIEKPNATQSSLVTSQSQLSGSSRYYYYYYYDTDFVMFDNFQIKYLGETPFLLDEDSISDQYIRDVKEQTNKSILLKRTFTLNKWNSLVLPVTVTTAQLKQAFGEGTQLAKYEGVGVTPGHKYLDFKTLSLAATEEDDKIIEKGQLYLIKPTANASEIKYTVEENGSTVTYTGKYYLLGRRDINGSDLVDPKDNTGEGTSTTTPLVWKGTYVTKENGCPEGAYVWSSGMVYHLQSAMTIKGFRGWFEEQNQKAESISMRFDNGEITSIDEVVRNDKANNYDGAVYTVDGVKVRSNATSLEDLPAGIYIFKGKKYIVK